MKLVKLYGKAVNTQAGQVLPMALVLLAAAVFVLVPALFTSQVSLGINSDAEKDTRGYYAAEAGIADVLWKFNDTETTDPFSLSSGKGDYYEFGPINGMTVRVALLNTPAGAGNFIIQSSALSEGKTQASVIALITQSASGNNIFDQAVASLNGDITLNNGAAIISDDVAAGNYGNIYANGNVTVNSAYVGGTGCPALGIASATGGITVKHGGCVGTSKPNQATPVSYTLTISKYTGPADAGINYTGQASNWRSGDHIYYVGPGYVNGNVTIAGAVTIVLTGNLHIKGTLTITNGALVKGPYTVICDGPMTFSGGAIANLAAGNIPFFITTSPNIGGKKPAYAVSIGGSAAVAAVIYAPNGTAYLSGGVGADGYNVYGSVIAKNVTVNSMTIKYLSGIHSETQIEGTGTGGTASLVGYDYR